MKVAGIASHFLSPHWYVLSSYNRSSSYSDGSPSEASLSLYEQDSLVSPSSNVLQTRMTCISMSPGPKSWISFMLCSPDPCFALLY